MGKHMRPSLAWVMLMPRRQRMQHRRFGTQLFNLQPVIAHQCDENQIRRSDVKCRSKLCSQAFHVGGVAMGVFVLMMA